MIRLIQYLCPQRHCVIAAAYDDTAEHPIRVAAMMRQRMKELQFNPWCGLCGSTKLQFEDAPTTFPDMATAMPALKAAERSNIAGMMTSRLLPKLN